MNDLYGLVDNDILQGSAFKLRKGLGGKGGIRGFFSKIQQAESQPKPAIKPIPMPMIKPMTKPMTMPPFSSLNPKVVKPKINISKPVMQPVDPNFTPAPPRQMPVTMPPVQKEKSYTGVIITGGVLTTFLGIGGLWWMKRKKQQ